jgi:class 3 adenylate cyclase
MTEENEALSIERRVVMVVDIRSSTSILDDLKQTDNLMVWRNLLIGQKETILAHRAKIGVEIYKFIGDGWILLFPEDITKHALVDFLMEVSANFDMGYDGLVESVLQRQPPQIGLTFGTDSGELIKLEMNQQTEYIGRAINVAARLQGFAKDLKPFENYQAVFSRHSFNQMVPAYNHKLNVQEVKANLKNLVGGEIDCIAFSPL